MNGNNVVALAKRLLGYDNDEGIVNEINSKGISAVNAVYADLFMKLKQGGCDGVDKNAKYGRIEDMSKAIALSDDIMNDCFVYGVASWIARIMGDGDNERFYSTLYEYKRDWYCRVACKTYVADKMP